MNTITILSHAKSQGFKAKRDGKTIVVNNPERDIYFKINNTKSHYAVKGWVGDVRLTERCYSDWDIIDLLQSI